MPIPTILQFPSDKLRRRAEPLPDAAFSTSALRDYCQILANLLVASERADVLAGTQIDFEQPWRVLALSTGNSKAVSILCNPEIKDMSGESVGFEMSASFACVPALLSAPAKLVVRYRKADGTRREIQCTRSGARAIFQGTESLDGKLLLDRMTAHAAMQFVKRYREELDELMTPRIFLPNTDITVPS